MLSEPQIGSVRPERHTVGKRARTPFKGMFAVVDGLLAELRRRAIRAPHLLALRAAGEQGADRMRRVV